MSVANLDLVGTLKPPPSRFSYFVTSENIGYATGCVIPATLSLGCISTWQIASNNTVGWTRNYTPSNKYEAWGVAVTVNSARTRVYVAGAADSAFGVDIYVLAYDATSPGTSPLWVRRYSNFGIDGDDVPIQILVDAEEYVYVAGTSDGSATGGSSTGPDFMVMKLVGATGASAWGDQANGCPVAARYDGPSHGKDTASEMALLAGGEVGTTQYIYVAGTSFGGSTGTDYAVLRVDATNPATTISVRTALTGNETCTSMTIGGGRVFATGYATTLATNTVDYVTWAFSNALVVDTNWPALGATFDSSGGDDMARVIVYSGSDAAVVVTGEAWRGPALGYDIATMKLNGGTGAPMWTGLNQGVRYFNNPNGSAEDRPSDMVIDKCGNTYISGKSFHGTSLDFFAISYMRDGDRRWQEFVGVTPTGRDYVTYNGVGNGTDFAACIRVTLEGGNVVNHAGDVFLFGQTAQTAAIQRYTVVRFDQIDPCPPPEIDPTCCN